MYLSCHWSGGVKTLKEIVQVEEVCLVWTEGGGLTTSCISYCSCMVRAVSVVLMLFLKTFCLSVNS